MHPRRHLPLSVVVVAGMLLFCVPLFGCNPKRDKRHVNSEPSAGRVQVRVGPDQHSNLATDATCRRRHGPHGEFLSVRLPDRHRLVTWSGVLYRRTLLQARLPTGLGAETTEFWASDADGPSRFRAVASIFDRTFAGHPYEMLQIFAADLPSTDISYRCRAARQGRRYRLTCFGGRPFPWVAPGPVPRAAFRAEFQCKSGD